VNGKYLYLFVDFLSLLFPLIFSFHPRNGFYQTWKFLWPAILVPAVIFIIWDLWFTQMGVWGFNQAYVTGIYFFNLPLEEILFFLCVPYACIFTYEAVGMLVPVARISSTLSSLSTLTTGLLVCLLIYLGILHVHQWYPSVTFFSLAAYLLLLRLIVNPGFLGKFYFSFLFILIPFFIVNGVLTGTGLNAPVVWYNDHENMGIRMGTIPVEDTFYGMLLILMNVSIFEWLQKRKSRLS
jgi:lycopene cyclase domain-containing protein